jgi:FAD/FMN-containing dehydrogenase
LPVHLLTFNNPNHNLYNIQHATMLLYKWKVWLLQAIEISVAPAQNDLEQAVAALMPQLSSGAIITLPSQPRWKALQIRASSPRLAPHYTVVVEAATEKDVQATVSLANRFNVPFLAVSGTHGWATSLNKFPYGVQINMRKLNTTTLGHDGKTAIVGGGILQHEITRSLFANGKYTGMTNIAL